MSNPIVTPINANVRAICVCTVTKQVSCKPHRHTQSNEGSPDRSCGNKWLDLRHGHALKISCDHSPYIGDTKAYEQYGLSQQNVKADDHQHGDRWNLVDQRDQQSPAMSLIQVVQWYRHKRRGACIVYGTESLPFWTGAFAKAAGFHLDFRSFG